MVFAAKNFDILLGVNGLSENMLKNHFTLYQGYVTNVNKLRDALALMLKDGKAGLPEFAELKRRFGWEFNGMRLHELYFENLSKSAKPVDMKSKLHKKISEDFGSFENWEKDFRATAGMRGVGWAVLYYDSASKTLFNTWINEHDAGHLAGAVPVLVVDVFEHAFMLDYGTKRLDYIEAVFKAIDWAVVEKRLK